MSEVNKIKVDMIDTVSVPDEYNPQTNITILPDDAVSITGARIIEGKIVQIFATDEDLEEGEAYVYGSIFGCGVAGYGYGYGFNAEDELEYFAQVEKYND